MSPRLVLCLVLVLLWTAPVRAGVHLGAGPADEIDGKASGVATVSWLTEQRHPWEWMAGYIAARHNSAYGDVPDATFLSVSKRLTWRGWFVSGGLAWVSEDNEVLSGHGQFLTGAGYDFGRIALSLRHLSNGDTSGRNRGETFLLVEYGF